MKTLATLLTAGVIFLHAPTGNYFGIGTDTTGNGYEDTLKIYQMVGQRGNIFKSEHVLTLKDLNENGILTEDEIVWKKGEMI